MFEKEWKELTTDPVILETITGYRLEFINDTPPIQNRIPHPYKLNETEKEAVSSEIIRLANMGVIEKADDSAGYVSNIFTRPKKDGGFRMILDLSALNKNIVYYHFKMDTLETAINLITKNCLMTSIDLKDAYYSVPVASEHRKYLQFYWQDQIWQFQALPNGLTSGPRIFTKLLKPPLSVLRKMGITVVAYIDDTLIISRTQDDACLAVTKVANTLLNLGFIVHPKKSVFMPSTQIRFLGFIIDSITMQVRLPAEKIAEIAESCTMLLSEQNHTIRTVATVLGKMVATFPAVQYGKLHYRELEKEKIKALKKNNGNFDSMMSLSPQAKADILWWLHNIHTSVRDIRRNCHTKIITSDASGLGWGATDGKHEIGGRWNRIEMIRAQNNEINYLEMLASFLALQAFCNNEKEMSILLRLDNTTAVAYLNNMGGTNSIACNQMAKTIWEWCRTRNIWIEASYLPGSINVIADKRSREFNDHLEYQLHPNHFQAICKQFGKPDIDLFASRLNTQLPRYVSWKPDPGAESIDAFTVHWSPTFFYAFPPFSLILKCLRKTETEEAEGIIIVPNWPTQPWFPLLLNLLISKPLTIPTSKNTLLLPGSGKEHPLHKHLSLLACRVSGSPSKISAFHQQLHQSFPQPGNHQQQNSMIHTSDTGWTFAVKGTLIHIIPQPLTL